MTRVMFKRERVVPRYLSKMFENALSEESLPTPVYLFHHCSIEPMKITQNISEPEMK